MRSLLLFLLILPFVLSYCVNDSECNNGYCQHLNTTNTSYCVCSKGYVNRYCNYEQIDHRDAIMISFFVGYTGADWFYLSRGDPGYIVVGLIKLFMLLSLPICYRLINIFAGTRWNSIATIGIIMPMITIPTALLWWLVDWIRLINGCSFKDGNGYCLYEP